MTDDKQKIVRVEQFYEDGSREYIDGENLELYQEGLEEAITNDYIHGAGARLFLDKVKWKEVDGCGVADALAQVLEQERIDLLNKIGTRFRMDCIFHRSQTSLIDTALKGTMDEVRDASNELQKDMDDMCHGF